MVNTRFSTALHVLVELAASEEKVLSSAELADKINTHAVVVRRLVALFKEAGLVNVTRGANGGVSLAKSPADISLGELADITEENFAFETNSIPVSVLNPDTFPDAVLSTIEGQKRKIQALALAHFEGVSLQDILAASILRSELTNLVAKGLSDEQIRNEYHIQNGHLVRK